MRYAIQPLAAGAYQVVDRRYPLRPVLTAVRWRQAASCVMAMSFRSAWGW
jgi:hypothetical protein